MSKRKTILISVIVISILIIGSIFYISSQDKKRVPRPALSEEEVVFGGRDNGAQLLEMEGLEEANQQLTEEESEKQLEEFDKLNQETLTQEQKEKQLDEMRKVQQMLDQL